MDTKDWITIGIATITLLNGWCQFWIKERLFFNACVNDDPILNVFTGKIGVTIIALTGVISILSMCLLAAYVTSTEPLTRVSCLVICSLTVLATLNMVLVQALFTMRRLAEMKKLIGDARKDALTYAMILGG